MWKIHSTQLAREDPEDLKHPEVLEDLEDPEDPEVLDTRRYIGWTLPFRNKEQFSDSKMNLSGV
jgi:hypothetical protein